MYAKAQALVAPINSNTVPRSQVNRDKITEETTRAVVNIKWRFGWYGSSGK